MCTRFKQQSPNLLQSCSMDQSFPGDLSMNIYLSTIQTQTWNFRLHFMLHFMLHVSALSIFRGAGRDESIKSVKLAGKDPMS